MNFQPTLLIGFTAAGNGARGNADALTTSLPTRTLFAGDPLLPADTGCVRLTGNCGFVSSSRTSELGGIAVVNRSSVQVRVAGQRVLSRTKQAILAAVLLAGALCFTPWLMAQETRGTINGLVTDASGAVVPGAIVSATNMNTNTVVSGKANGSGLYTIPLLQPGTYKVSAQAPGFKTIERLNIELQVNQTLDVDLHLQVGDASESVTVTSAPPQLETESASQGEVVDTKRIEDLPLQAGNPAEMILFAPGVTNSTNLRARKTSFNSASSQFVTDGNQLYSNEFTIDGVPDTFASAGTPLVAFQPPQFAVNQFQVLTAGYDAAVGHATGSVVNLVTQSGTDRFHGEVHEFMSNSYLDASTYFQQQAQLKKPEYQDNRYGASLGGPVAIPHFFHGDKKTFFFYAWEANKWGKPVTTVGTVPTAAEKQGDFSSLLTAGCTGTISKVAYDGTYAVDPATGVAHCGSLTGPTAPYQIYNPFTAVAKSGGHVARSAFAGNIIPTGLLDKTAQNIMAFYAQPNTVGTSAGQNNYTQSIKDVFDYYVHFVRVDHVFSERNRMFARFDYDHYLETDPGFYGNLSGGINLTRINRGGELDDVIILSPSNVVDVHYGFTQEEAPEQKISTGINLASLGFSQNLVSQLNPSAQAFPMIYINTKQGKDKCSGACTGTYSGFGNSNNGNGTITGYIHQGAATLSSTKGSHDLHLGGEFRLYRSFGDQAPFDVAPGYQFLGTFTDATDTSTPAIGQDLAGLELGIPSYGLLTRSASYATQDVYGAFFAQDNWKVNRRFTLNVGLRIEHESPVTERFNRSIRGFDTTAVNPVGAQAAENYAGSPSSLLPPSQFKVLGGLQFASTSARDLWEQPYLTYMPRFGFAYLLDEQTVLRGGYGMFYDTIGINRTVVYQPGFTATTLIAPTADNGLHFIASLPNPFPNGLESAVGSSGGLKTSLGQPITYYPVNRQQPYSQRTSLGIQHTFPSGFMVDISYVGNKAIHLSVANNINATPLQYLSNLPTRDAATIQRLGGTVPNPFYGLDPGFTSKTITVANLLRPFPEFGDITRIDNNGYSWYHSLQTRLEKRFVSGFTLNVAYTWSRFSEATSYLNSGDTQLNRSISQYDRPQRIVVSGIWDIPVGRSRKYLNNSGRIVDGLLGGWQLNTSFEQQSGDPLSFGDVILKSGNPDPIALPSGSRSVNQWFNTSLFDTLSSDQRQYDVRTFPQYISSVRGPDQSQLNGSAFKTVQLDGPLAFQFRLECYDILNHYNFSDPSTSVTSSSFGRITAQGSPGRQFQAALRLFF